MGNHTPWKLLCSISLILLCVTGVITAIQFHNAPPNTTFTGYSYESGGDIFIYLNLIAQAKEGHMSFENFFSSDIQGGRFFQPLFLFLGWVARLFHLTPLLVWHGMRLMLIPITVSSVWWSLRLLQISVSQSRWIICATLFMGALPLSNIEASPFVLLLYSPLHTLTFILTVLFVGITYRLLYTENSRRVYVLLPVLFVLQATLHPYVLLVWCVLPLTVGFLRFVNGEIVLRQLGKRLTPFVIGTVIAATYLFIVIDTNSAVRSWAFQSTIPPWPWQYIGLFLLPYFPLIYLFWKRGRNSIQKPPSFLYIHITAATIILLACSPYPYAGRLTIFVQFPLSILLGMCFEYIWKNQAHVYRIFIMACFAFGLIGNSSHLTQNIMGDYRPYGYRPNAYLPDSVLQSFEWMHQHLPANALLLTSSQWDTIVASYTHRHVYVTQGWTTENLSNRLRETLAVYSGQFAPSDLYTFLTEHHITHILLSDRDRLTGYWQRDLYNNPMYESEYAFRFQPIQYPFLFPLYTNADLTLYQLIKE